MKLVHSLVLVVAICLGFAVGSPKTNAAQQLLSILDDPSAYDKNVFPDTQDPINVDINMYLRGMELDDVNMRINLDLTFRMMWRDSRLSYSEPGVRSIRFMDYTKFWLPDPFFKNSIETRQMQTVHPEAYIAVDSRGNITFSTRFQVTSKCALNLKRYPHDEQVCRIAVASYGFSKDDMIFRFKSSDPVSVVKELHISNYMLVDQETAECTSKTSTGEYSCIALDLHFQRQFATYLLEWYLPCISYVIIALLSELISVDSLLPRLVLTIGPLLALTASSASYSSNLASVAYTKALDVFTGMSILTIFVICLHVIVSYYLYSKKVDEKTDSSLDSEKGTKMQMIKSKLSEHGDFYSRVIIIGFYPLFLFLYFLAYSF